MMNINKSDDFNYRYKMPSINIKLGGSGNGIYTILNNIEDIAPCINTPSEILYKYISYVCGSAFNEKKKCITGHHTNIQDIIFEYIDEFVICKICGIPELTYELEKVNSKNYNVQCKCTACGNINNISGNNKINTKCLENIQKYLMKEKTWTIKKGFTGVN